MPPYRNSPPPRTPTSSLSRDNTTTSNTRAIGSVTARSSGSSGGVLQIPVSLTNESTTTTTVVQPAPPTIATTRGPYFKYESVDDSSLSSSYTSLSNSSCVGGLAASGSGGVGSTGLYHNTTNTFLHPNPLFHNHNYYHFLNGSVSLIYKLKYLT